MEGSSADPPAGNDGGVDRPFRFDTPSYERLLRRVREAGRSFVGFDERGDGVVLHHNVELSLDRALTMARLEATMRVDATYCVPLDAPVHDTSTVTFAHTVRTLSQLGHDVGLQFDAHAHWDDLPSDAAIRKRVEDRRAVLERLVGAPVEVVSFRRPTERLRRLEFDGAVNADRPPADDGRRPCLSDLAWDGEGADPFGTGVPERFRLLVHPGLWHPSDRSRRGLVEEYRAAAHEQVDAYFDTFEDAGCPPTDGSGPDASG